MGIVKETQGETENAEGESRQVEELRNQLNV